MKTLIVNEIFYSLQGEGPYAGFPAVFLRLNGCVAPFCSFCDTPASLTCDNGITKSVESILAEVVSLAKCSLIVITGGEPFLQWEDGLSELEEKLLNLGYMIQYETSGKVLIPPPKLNRTVICSPKQIGDFSSNNWSFIAKNTQNIDFFKFVYSENSDQIKSFIDVHKIREDKVYLMPEGKTRSEQLEKIPDAWNCCSKNGWKLSPRLHILAFDEKKGI